MWIDFKCAALLLKSLNALAAHTPYIIISWSHFQQRPKPFIGVCHSLSDTAYILLCYQPLWIKIKYFRCYIFWDPGIIRPQNASAGIARLYAGADFRMLVIRWNSKEEIGKLCLFLCVVFFWVFIRNENIQSYDHHPHWLWVKEFVFAHIVTSKRTTKHYKKKK